jgi:hypothetical protein
LLASSALDSPGWPDACIVIPGCISRNVISLPSVEVSSLSSVRAMTLKPSTGSFNITIRALSEVPITVPIMVMPDSAPLVGIGVVEGGNGSDVDTVVAEGAIGLLFPVVQLAREIRVIARNKHLRSIFLSFHLRLCQRANGAANQPREAGRAVHQPQRRLHPQARSPRAQRARLNWRAIFGILVSSPSMTKSFDSLLHRYDNQLYRSCSKRWFSPRSTHPTHY